MTRVFWNGRSQAVRLPQECRFDEGQELVVRRAGRAVIIEPAGDFWAGLKDALKVPLAGLERPAAARSATSRESIERMASKDRKALRGDSTPARSSPRGSAPSGERRAPRSVTKRGRARR